MQRQEYKSNILQDLQQRKLPLDFLDAEAKRYIGIIAELESFQYYQSILKSKTAVNGVVTHEFKRNEFLCKKIYDTFNQEFFDDELKLSIFLKLVGLAPTIAGPLFFEMVRNQNKGFLENLIKLPCFRYEEFFQEVDKGREEDSRYQDRTFIATQDFQLLVDTRLMRNKIRDIFLKINIKPEPGYPGCVTLQYNERLFAEETRFLKTMLETFFHKKKAEIEGVNFQKAQTWLTLQWYSHVQRMHCSLPNHENKEVSQIPDDFKERLTKRSDSRRNFEIFKDTEIFIPSYLPFKIARLLRMSVKQSFKANDLAAQQKRGAIKALVERFQEGSFHSYAQCIEEVEKKMQFKDAFKQEGIWDDTNYLHRMKLECIAEDEYDKKVPKLMLMRKL